MGPNSILKLKNRTSCGQQYGAKRQTSNPLIPNSGCEWVRPFLFFPPETNDKSLILGPSLKHLGTEGTEITP